VLCWLLCVVVCSPSNIQLVQELLAQWMPLEELFPATGETALLMAVDFDDAEVRVPGGWPAAAAAQMP
jgi:hypothetical protein